ncbi:uncharacterized protein LOC126687670 [Mercurialis annua]|uniref:uncharacterized protein LOC126687670 n=1 Tax=Mercurialis annua TaxID=3986 RepID=UPI00215E6EEB|nr:uncharacterized protein LOC126687670 [Mercurialis annua]
MNHTFITLIPKKASPESMKDLRPISLCNVIYKFIAEVLANRLKRVLPSLIHESQSTFVPGKLITYNALIAFELFHSMAKRSQGRMGSIALEWSFIEKAMGQMGFPGHFIKLISACISSVTFSFLVNGNPYGFLLPQRGLRQGDPLSPYLFLICVEDDSVLFAQASDTECYALKRIISAFEVSSGQVVNFDKSELLFSAGVPQRQRHSIQQILGIQVVDSFKKYLGMPTMVGRSKKPIFSFLKDRLNKRVFGWKERFLSKAGREVLIKSVAQSIPTYIMSCFALPVSFCSNMQSIISKFWWSETDEKRIPWLNRPNALFRILNRVFKAKYFPNDLFIRASLKRGASFVWRVLWRGRKFSMRGQRGGLVVDRDKIDRAFSVQDVNEILKIPFSRRLPPDKLFWPANKNGFFTVKSCYYKACNIINKGVAGSSISSDLDGLWNKIWKCSVWCGSRNNPPCIERLRGSPGSLLLSPLNLRVHRSPAADLIEWLCSMFTTLKSDELQVFVTSLWIILNDHNNVVFENHRVPAQFLFRSVIALCDTISDYQVQPQENAPVVWQAPPPNWVKINTDAAIVKHKNLSIIAAVCRDQNGDVVRCGVQIVHGLVEIKLAETYAIRMGLQLAAVTSVHDVIIESNALTVIQRLRNPSSAIDNVKLIVDDFLALVQDFNVVFQHINRNGNQVAHALAKRGVFRKRL